MFPEESCEAGNLPLFNGRFAGNSALLPTDVIEFAMLPVKRFWQKTVSLLNVM